MGSSWGRIACSACCVGVRSWRATRTPKWQSSRCPGKSPLLAAMVADSRQHKLWLFTSGGRVGMVCVSCGAHTTASKLDYLGFTCRKSTWSRPLREALSRFGRGIHPHPPHGARIECAQALPAYLDEDREEGVVEVAT